MGLVLRNRHKHKPVTNLLHSNTYATILLRPQMMVTIFQKLDIYIIPYVDHNLFMVNYLFDKTNII